jgi:hypothetical protein
MSHIEPPPPQQGATSRERGPNISDLEREVAESRSLPQKLLAAASPKLYFGVAKEYPAGIKQFLWLCLGILYPFWLIAVVIAWPVIMIAQVVGKILFAIWWLCTGWFWKRLGGERPTAETMAEIDADRAAKIEATRAEQYE